MRWLRGLWRRWRGRCPKCGGILFRIAYWNGGVLEYDRCPECDWASASRLVEAHRV